MPTTPDPLRAAATALRASVNTLPEGFRGKWGLSREGRQVVPLEPENRFYVVANASLAAPHIALTASPPVVLAVAAWLEAIADECAGEPCEIESHAAAYRLAAAILAGAR